MLSDCQRLNHGVTSLDVVNSPDQVANADILRELLFQDLCEGVERKFHELLGHLGRHAVLNQVPENG